MAAPSTPVGTTLRRATLKPTYDALVIGSGIGGLTAAACLAKTGEKVLVLEQHYTPGGFTHTFQRKGYEWSVGVHYVGEVHKQQSLLRKIFDAITNGKLQWRKIENPYDQVILGDEVYDFVAGREAFRAKIVSYFPQEQSAIDRYLSLLDEVGRSAFFAFSQQAMPAWIPQTPRQALAKNFLTYASRTTADVLGEITSNKKLALILTAQWGDYGLPPEESSFAMHALVAKHYLDGASYPVGGPSSIARYIAPIIQEPGGDIVTSAHVAEIVIQHRKAVGVRMQDGREIFAPRIISAVGVANTYQHLLPQAADLDPKIFKQSQEIGPSTAHLCLYLGLEGSAKDLGLHSANLWILTQENHDESISKLRSLLGVETPVVFISFPSTKDPLWTQYHPGTSTIEMVIPIPFEPFSRWKDTHWQKRGSDYETFKAGIVRALLDFLAHYVPEVKDHVAYAELSTPLSTAKFTHYDHGEIYGLRHDPQRFQQTWFRTEPGVKRLYLTGQDTITCGIGGACISGALTALRILGPLKGGKLMGMFLGD